MMVELSKIELETPLTPEQEPDILRMAESIKAKGLLHSPTGYIKDGKVVVFAGSKRVEGCKRVGLKFIDVNVLVGQPTQEQRNEVHIHENLFRLNLPWYEQVELERQLHEMRQKQHGPARAGRNKTGWSLRDTAAELGSSLGAISQDIRLAEAVLNNPHLRKITDKVTAQRLVFQEYKRIESEVEAGIVPKGIEFDICLNGDSSEILKFYPANTFNACVTDPPWLEYKEKRLTKDDKTLNVFKELFRVMKQESFVYMFVSTPDFFIYQQELPKFGFKVQEMPLIWVKEGVLSHGLRSWEYARDYEPILLAVKGTPVLANQGQISAVFSHPVLHPSKLIHPHEKPMGLIKRILDHCTYEGSLVVDPFGGSGVTAHTCKEMKRRYVTIERDKKFFDNIARRLGQVEPIVDNPLTTEDD